MTSKTEAAVIRSQLRLKWDAEAGCYMVYTTLHGSGIFRWFKISETTMNWYRDTFNLEVEADLYISASSGEIFTGTQQRNAPLLQSTGEHNVKA